MTLTAPSISVDTVQTPGGVAVVLQRLAAGERVSFTDRTMAGSSIVSFSIQKTDGAYAVRDSSGRVVSTAPTFSEAWRSRPRIDATSTGDRR